MLDGELTLTNFDKSFEKIKAIFDDAGKNIENIVSEEDAKLQIINRVLVEALSWKHSDLQAETRHESGFSDYILSIKGAPGIVVEAKRIGKLEIGTVETRKMRHLKISGAGLSKIQKGIDQAYNYAAPNGLNLAVLTDGIVWVFFKTFIPGENYKSKEAIIFPSFEAILNDYATFFELIAKETFEKKLYAPIFDSIHKSRGTLAAVLHSALPEDQIRISKKSSISFDLEGVFTAFFSRLTGEHDKDLLIECFVETRESRIADFSLEKMTANVLGNIAPVDRSVDTELANLIETNFEGEEGFAAGGQTVFIVGPTGAGKTTFLDRFFRKTLPSTIRNRCVVTRVNCLDSTGSEDTVLSWLTEEIILSVEQENYDGGTPTYDDLQGLYFSQYQRRSKGVDAHLYSRDKAAFKEKFGEFLDKEVEQHRESYLKRMLTNSVKSRHRLPIFVVDNTDEFSAEFKRDVFQFIQALVRHTKHCIAIFPVTDKSAWSFSKTDIFGIYNSRSFFLPTPSPREVFRKRIDFLQKLLSSDIREEEKKSYFSRKGIKISIKNLEAFAKVLEDIFVEHDYTSKTIGELTNYNIRRTLILSQRVITSSVFYIEDLIKSYFTGQLVATSFNKFMDALLKGNYEAYKATDNPEIFPIFQSDRKVAQSPLAKLRVLALLESAAHSARSIDERHLNVESIVAYFDAIGGEETSIDQALISLLEHGLIEPYDASSKNLAPKQLLAISFRGLAHLRLAINNGVFFYQMAITTGISDSDKAAKIASVHANKKISFQERVGTVKEEFAKHLMSEDSKYFNQDTTLVHYESQRKLIDDLLKISNSSPDQSSDDPSVLGREFGVGYAQQAVLGVVEWFDTKKGFGFVNIDEIGTSVFLHKEVLKKAGLTFVDEGDELLCDLKRETKGLAVSKVHAIELDLSNVEVETCIIARVFPDRGYAFVSLEEGGRDAWLNLSIVEPEDMEKLVVGRRVDAEIIQDKGRKDLRVKRIRAFQLELNNTN